MQTLNITKKYEKYPEYKDSGYDWFGNVPKSWEIGPLRSVLNERIEKNKKLVTDNILSVMKDVGVIRYADKGDVGNKSSDRPENYKIVYPKDIVLNSMNLVIGSVGQSKELGVTSSVYIIYYPKNKNINSDYYHYLFRDKTWQKTLGRLGKGIMELRESINSDLLKVEPVIIPSFDEQTKIASYLDEKTQLIDKIIEKKEKLIDLLKEKRTAVINNAVTKGLDKNTPFVESGVEWIGKIPKGWEIRKIKTISNIKRGASPRPIDDKKYFDDNGEYSWVRIEDLTASERYLIQTTQKLSSLGKSLSVPLEPGEIFLSIAGSVGKPIITKIKCCIHDGFVCFKNLNCNSEYLYYVFIAGEAYKGLGKLGTQLNLNSTIVGNILIPLPSKIEQESIVLFLDEKMRKMDNFINKEKSSIELLKEFKISLISNVVTGKIKV